VEDEKPCPEAGPTGLAAVLSVVVILCASALYADVETAGVYGEWGVVVQLVLAVQ